MSQVLLVNMPFGNVRWPNLGPSLLQAALKRDGIACDMAYLNFDFAELIGLEDYQWIADHFGFVLGGERLFARHYFGDRLPSADAYFHDVLLAADPGLSEEDRGHFEAIGQQVGPFLSHCMERIDFGRYVIIGFASTFQQTMPSLCLARRIKQIHPRTTIVMGGAACEDEMGREMAARFPELDYVFLGEADESFPAFVRTQLGGDPAPLPPGIAAGRAGTMTAEQVGGNCSAGCPVRDLDALPYPDFDDYFARLKASSLGDEVDPLLFFETARGCWWGAKSQCLFCGLNGASLHFRSKSAPRAMAELKHLVERYGVRKACAADNILDPRYFDTLLPMLAESELGLRFEYEMKTNLTRHQVRQLVLAGLRAAQLGIETFSTPLLKLMRKGATALMNVQALKWFTAAGIEVKWNLLYGFPGEDPTKYEALADLLPSLTHLAPPSAVGRVRLDRFSPYFRAAETYGMLRPRAALAFGNIFPFPEESLRRLAYYFEFDYADGRVPESYAQPFVDAALAWQQAAGSASLRAFDRGDGVLLISDTRPVAVRYQHRLSGIERDVYLACDPGRSPRQVLELLSASAEGLGAMPPAADTVQSILDRFVFERLAVRLEGCYLSLAIEAPA
ncbi:MAG: RiPP maturation radical SAM C-methyltransferase [Planctomycetota bacterium]